MPVNGSEREGAAWVHSSPAPQTKPGGHGVVVAWGGGHPGAGSVGTFEGAPGAWKASLVCPANVPVTYVAVPRAQNKDTDVVVVGASQQPFRQIQ